MLTFLNFPISSGMDFKLKVWEKSQDKSEAEIYEFNDYDFINDERKFDTYIKAIEKAAEEHISIVFNGSYSEPIDFLVFVEYDNRKFHVEVRAESIEPIPHPFVETICSVEFVDHPIYHIEIDPYAKTTYYYKKGTNLFHREDGPAIKWTHNSERWYIDGKLHRTDGPAVVCENYNEWWINGEKLSKEKTLILNKWWNNKNGI